MIALLVVVVLARAEENAFKKPWEIIPVIEGLKPATTYQPAYIDDTFDEQASTVDLFIFQQGENVAWASDIRGTSASIKPNVILNSICAEVKMNYFDEDAYPDLLIISPDRKSLKFLKNKVRENQEILKREQFNPDLAEIASKLEDWPKYDLYSSKSSTLIDFWVADLNHDGISDVILAVKLSSGINSIINLIFSSSSSLEHKSHEITFDNRGIVKLLGVMSSENSKNSILYLSKAGHLARMVNRDPVHISENLVYLNQTDSIDFFITTDLDKNGLPDFIIGFAGLALWAFEDKEGWTSRLILDDGMVKMIQSSGSDFIILYKNKVNWGFAVQAKPKNEEFYWDVAGDAFVFHYKEIMLEQKYTWNDLEITDFKKSGSVDLLLMSEEMKTIFWGRKKPSNIQGLGWGPEFWIYIMIYVIIMSLGAGIFHSHSAEQLEEQNNFIKALGSQQEFAVNPLKGKPSQRKTTV